MKLIYVLSALMFFLYASCTDVIDIDLQEGPVRLVVEGGIELKKEAPSGHQSLRLTTTAPYFSNQAAPGVQGAVVKVRDDTGRIYGFTESTITEGLYETDSLNAQLNHTYTLMIEWRNDHYEGMETLAPVTAIDSIYQVFVEETIFDDGGIRIRIDYTDPPSQENYYYWLQYKNGEYLLSPNPGTTTELLSSDEFYDGQRVIGKEPLSETNYVSGDTALVRQFGLSKEAFDYHFLLYEQTGGTGFVETPSTTIRGNIRNTTHPDNYPLGYFRASEVSEAEIVIQ